MSKPFDRALVQTGGKYHVLWSDLMEMVLAWEDEGESADDLVCAIITRVSPNEVTEEMRERVAAILR